MQGKIIKGIAGFYYVYAEDSVLYECKARGAYLMGLTNYGNYAIEDLVDFTIYIPKTEDIFAESLAIIPLQLMGYYMSVAKGLDVASPPWQHRVKWRSYPYRCTPERWHWHEPHDCLIL